MSTSSQCEATSLEGFVQQLACNLLLHGFMFWSAGWIPAGKDPAAVDRKLVAKYNCDATKWERSRNKRAEVANVRYLRHERFFVLVATHGNGRFFDDEQPRDFRKSPLRYMGYSISHRGGHAHVRIEREQYKTIKAHLLEIATKADADALASVLGGLPFEPYGPVRRQLITLLRFVNRARKAAGLSEVPFECLRLARYQVPVFAQKTTLREGG